MQAVYTRWNYICMTWQTITRTSSSALAMRRRAAGVGSQALGLSVKNTCRSRGRSNCREPPCEMNCIAAA